MGAQERHLDAALTRGFAQQHTITFQAVPMYRRPQIRITGHVACSGMIVISVIKHLDVLDATDDPFVCTRRYAYNAFVASHREFLRHDNAHHFHEFDWQTGRELNGGPQWCGEKGWPHLSEFIDKAHDWYDEHCDDLPDPTGVVPDLAPYDERLRIFEVA